VLHRNSEYCDNRAAFFRARWATFTLSDALPATQVSCPAFGGVDFNTLYATSATQGLSPASLKLQPDAGKTFVVVTETRGQPEHQVQL
jgi:sugar lactone lactonase YvrE